MAELSVNRIAVIRYKDKSVACKDAISFGELILDFETKIMYKVLQKIPANTTLETAINNEYVEVVSAFQADWNQNDSTKIDYIKNRIAYDSRKTLVPSNIKFIEGIDGKLIGGLDTSGYIYFNPTTPCITGQTYRFSLSNGLYFDVTTSGAPDNSAGGGGGYVNDPSTGIAIGGGLSWNINGLPDAPNNETMCVSLTTTPGNFEGVELFVMIGTEGELHKIDDKFLVQSDWNQNDNTKADFIKNRPFYESNENIWKVKNIEASWHLYTNDGQPLEDDKQYYVSLNNDIFGPYSVITYEDGSRVITYSFLVDGMGQGGGTYIYNPNGVPDSPNNEKYFFSGGGNPSYVTGKTLTIFSRDVVKIPAKFIPEVFKDTFNADMSGSIEVDFSKNFFKSNSTTSINVNASGLSTNKTYITKIIFSTSLLDEINIEDFVHFTDTDSSYIYVYTTNGITKIVKGKQYLLTINYMKQFLAPINGAIVVLNFEETTMLSY